jgi:hypothetical protein
MLFQGWSVEKKPNQPGNPWNGHPFHRENNVNGIDDLLRSTADWISPSGNGGEDYQGNPPAADGSKVIIVDTDHLWGVGGDRTWVWKTFARGLNPIYMDPFEIQDGTPRCVWNRGEPFGWEAQRSKPEFSAAASPDGNRKPLSRFGSVSRRMVQSFNRRNLESSTSGRRRRLFLYSAIWRRYGAVSPKKRD